MYLSVYIHKKIKQIDRLYTYSVPSELEKEVAIGKRVLVPFGRGNRYEIAYIIDIKEEATIQKGLKDIVEVMDQEPVLSDVAIELGLFMKHEYLSTYMQAFSPLLPDYSVGKIDEKLTPISPEAHPLFKQRDFCLKSELSPEEREEMAKLLSDGKVKRELFIHQKLEERTFIHLKVIETTEENLTEKQQLAYDYILNHGPVLPKVVQIELDISSSPIDALIKKGLVTKVELPMREKKPERTLVKPHDLNPEQDSVFREILKHPTDQHLIYGITGSGKTEIYLHLTEEALKNGKGAIILVPEISLTPQMVKRFKDVFGEEISVLHSRLSSRERALEWSRLREGKSSVVIGARSAIFAPVENLSLIIIDEEQEQSYELHNNLRYDTIEVAKKRAELEKACLVLGSATPSVERYYKALEGEIMCHKLTKRAHAEAELPDTRIVDMRRELEDGNLSMLSRDLYEQIEKTLERGEQVILFLNRRGYAQFVSCRTCGHVITCDSCDISMTYHKGKGRLVCHYCGRTKPMVKTCPECGSRFIKEFGIGTEQIEEEVRKFFPQANILRMDRDTMNHKDSYQRAYEKMVQGKVDILIGTQMLAKGLDFPKVTLVGIIAADSSLYISDYRAQERTFQLLTQVSGRAGRREHRGQVIIQTYVPQNYSIQFAKDLDYDHFYEHEIQLRRQFAYPPFTKLFHLMIKSRNYQKAMQITHNWHQTLEYILHHKRLNLEIEGPNEMLKIDNQFGFQIQVKCPVHESSLLLRELERVLNQYYMKENTEDIYLTIDID